MYTEEQIFLLKHFTFDANGCTIGKAQKAFLYYAFTIRHPEAKLSSMPIAEMLSSEQTMVEISHFLSNRLCIAKKVLNKEFTSTHIEIDFSWAKYLSIRMED